MRRVPALMLGICLLSASLSSAQKPEEWLPITPQDWQIKDAPGNPGASAIQLYYSYYRDDNDEFLTEYRRIKVLRDSARRTYADVEIPLDPGMTLADLAARTIHPDGTIVDFKDKPFTKTVIKTRGIKFTAKTFTLPDVTVGSIIEYKSKRIWHSHHVSDSEWDIQGDLYTVRADFKFRPYQGFVETYTDFSGDFPRSRVSYAYLNQVDVTIPKKNKGNLMELEVQNVPAFDREEYMPPESDFKPIVIFYYGAQEVASPDKFWDWLGKLWPDLIENFIGSHKEVQELARQVIGSETDPEKKLRKLYARAQQIRNLSYERERTDQEVKQENLKRNRNVADVLEHGYGTANDIDRLFVALARSAGFEANILQVSDRKERSFNKLVLSISQVQSEAAVVKVNGKELVLDPGTKYCPYGLLRWMHTSVTALKMGKKTMEFVTTPAAPASSIHRTANLVLTPDGSAKGEITVELNGEDALESRLDALDADEAARHKSFEDFVTALLPAGAIVKLRDMQGWDVADGPLVGHLTVEIPNFASVTGKRLIASALVFSTFQKKAFAHEGRKYPIVFGYPFDETDQVNIKLPEGYSLEAPPYRRKAGLSYAGYEVSSVMEQNQLVTKRSLNVDGLSFPPEKYDELKNFFSVVQAGDGGQAVFRPQETASADKKD
ncbi:MAG TPA: DUF3857 domain-containing protein [Candidatus Angelobacter sp.]